MGQIMTEASRRAAVVTGASQGIGAAIAIRLARDGYRVLMAARSQDKLDGLRGTILAADGKAEVHAADLRRADACTALIDQAASSFGGLDLLVNCAGSTKSGDFFSLPEEDFIDGFALKFHAAVNLTRAAWPHLVQSGNGHIVNIIGIGARRPLADYTIGGPVNSALLSFTKAMADRGVTDGVRVNGINPGFIETDRVGVWLSRIAARDQVPEESARESLVREQRILRIGKPEEIAALVAFLDSPEAGYFHGAILDIDGGAIKCT